VGSGKSTTLAALIDYRNANASGHIVTVEDPIEFVHTHKMSIVTQREVGIDTHGYGSALKHTLRQAPDVILIGEIRDVETMEAAIDYAETGHLCLSTIHANNANQAIDRMVNFFPEDRRSQLLMDLSLNLRAMVSQRLIPKKEGRGRVAAVEILLNSPLISDLIFKGEIHELKELMKKSRELGMQTFDQSLMSILKANLITYEEALRQATNPDDFALRVSGISGTSDSKWDSFEKAPEQGATPAAPRAPATASPRSSSRPMTWPVPGLFAQTTSPCFRWFPANRASASLRSGPASTSSCTR